MQALPIEKVSSKWRNSSCVLLKSGRHSVLVETFTCSCSVFYRAAAWSKSAVAKAGTGGRRVFDRPQTLKFLCKRSQLVLARDAQTHQTAAAGVEAVQEFSALRSRQTGHTRPREIGVQEKRDCAEKEHSADRVSDQESGETTPVDVKAQCSRCRCL